MTPLSPSFPSYTVHIAGVLAGYLIRHETGQVAFRFDDNYWNVDKRPVLGQQFEDDRKEVYKGRQRKLPAFFANLVPEGQMRTMIAHSLGLDEVDDLKLLNAVGDDLPGAISIASAEELLPFPVAIDNKSEQLADEIKPDTDLDPNKLRFSLAGVQMKFSLVRQEDKLSLPAHNSLGRWIAKVDSLRFPHLTENEYVIMEWARAVGFEVPPCELLDSSVLPDGLRQRAPAGSKLFLIKRYDRDGAKRIHQEDFAQVAGQMPDNKYGYVSYERCAQLVLNICDPDEYREFLRRLVFMVASGNIDAHLKNWSFLYPDGYNPKLTPMYDQVCTIAWPEGIDMEWALTFMKTRDLYVIDEAYFVRLIKASGGESFADLKLIQDTLIGIVEAWESFSAKNILPYKHLHSLQQYWQKVPLLKKFADRIY